MKNTEGLPRVWVRSREERCQQDIKKSPFWVLVEILCLCIACVQTTYLRAKIANLCLMAERSDWKNKQTHQIVYPQKKSAAKKTASIQKKVKVWDTQSRVIQKN